MDEDEPTTSFNRKVVLKVTLVNILLGIPGIIPAMTIGFLFAGKPSLAMAVLFLISLLIWLFLNYMMTRKEPNRVRLIVLGFILFALSSGVAVGVFFFIAAASLI